MYQATYGYLAKFALPISQVYFVKLQSSPCYCDFTFLPSPLPNCKVNFATWQTPQCYLANLWIMLFKKHSAWSKLLPKIKLPLVLFLFFMGWLTRPHPFSFYFSLSLLFFFFFVVCLYGSLKLQKSRLCSFFYFFMLFKDFFRDMNVCLCGVLCFPTFLIGHMVTCKNVLKGVGSNVTKSIWSWNFFLLGIEKKPSLKLLREK